MTQPISFRKAAAVLQQSFSSVTGDDGVLTRGDMATAFASSSSQAELRDALLALIDTPAIFDAIARKGGSPDGIELDELVATSMAASEAFKQYFHHSALGDNALSPAEGARLRELVSYFKPEDATTAQAYLSQVANAQAGHDADWGSWHTTSARSTIAFAQGLIAGSASAKMAGEYLVDTAAVEELMLIVARANTSPAALETERPRLERLLREMNLVERATVLSRLDAAGAPIRAMILDMPLPDGEKLSEDERRSLQERLGMVPQTRVRPEPPAYPMSG